MFLRRQSCSRVESVLCMVAVLVDLLLNNYMLKLGLSKHLVLNLLPTRFPLTSLSQSGASPFVSSLTTTWVLVRSPVAAVRVGLPQFRQNSGVVIGTVLLISARGMSLGLL